MNSKFAFATQNQAVGYASANRKIYYVFFVGDRDKTILRGNIKYFVIPESDICMKGLWTIERDDKVK